MITLTPEQQQDVARRFQGLATRWIATARYCSNTQALRNHAVYQELVALGEPVVPLILLELERQPRVSWFIVLTGITGENPVPPRLPVRSTRWPGRGSIGDDNGGMRCERRTGAGLPEPRRRRLHRGQPPDSSLQLRCLGRRRREPVVGTRDLLARPNM